MKENYNLKKVIDEELKDLYLDSELKASIKTKCLGETKQLRKKNYRLPRSLAYVAVWSIGILGLFSGSLYAINHFEGFNMFLEESVIHKIAPHIQSINKEDGKAQVKMVVEAAITDHYNSLLVFSLINEGEEPWTEGVRIGEWDDSWAQSGSYGEPILSEDGRKLTYYVQGHGFEDILENKKMVLKASNIIQTEEVEEAIDIPLGELFKAHGTIIDMSDYQEADHKQYDYFYKELEKSLQKKLGDSQSIILREDPLVSLEYFGLIQDARLGDSVNPEGGLTLYTRNASDKYWTGTSHDYVVGTISEITDIRTGKIYKASTRGSMGYDAESLWKGSLGVSQFNEIMNPEDLPYLKATKVTYEIQKVLTKQDWEVAFEVKDTTTIAPINLNLDFSKNGESIEVQEMNLSVLGITLTGSKTGQIEDPSQEDALDNLKVEVYKKDGEIIALQPSSMMAREGKFTMHYIVLDSNRKEALLEIEEIDKILINGEQVWTGVPAK